MKERVNKPRAFLSYSSQDEAFIEKIEADFRKCQIDSWRDRNEIRHGSRWQQVIFEEGLPTCDVVIAYFTEDALASDMVAKEVDAAQLRQLQDNGIAFLPYVDKPDVRGKLRLDIQSLHCRVWNAETYDEVLPSVIAEVWRSYMERTVAAATLLERSRRLEAELQLERLQARLTASAFTPQEESEFQYAYKKLMEPVTAYRTVRVQDEDNKTSQSTVIGRCRFGVQLVELLVTTIRRGNRKFGRAMLIDLAGKFESGSCLSQLPSTLPEGRVTVGHLYFEEDWTPQLLILGMARVEKSNADFGATHFTSNYAFTDKMYRLVSWLEYYDKIGDEMSVESIGFQDKASYSKSH